MCKISVIVAVYQAEKYLIRCLDSLKNQTFPDFEVLLIDDGSKDCSGRICDDFAEKDSRFKVYHKKNGGVSSARQMGLDKAVGEYVIHVDPDDWIEINMLQELYATAQNSNADLVICDFYVETPQKRIYQKEKPNLQIEKQFFYDMIATLHGSCWNKLVRRSCFDKYKINFSQNMIMWEDKFINLKLAEQPIKVSYLPKAFYHYDGSINNNSAVRLWSRKKLESQKTVINWLEQKNDPIVNKEIVDLKKDAKITAFFSKEICSNEFRNLYPEINSCYQFRIKEIGRFNFFMYLAIHVSLSFARSLNAIKENFKNLISAL